MGERKKKEKTGNEEGRDRGGWGGEKRIVIWIWRSYDLKARVKVSRPRLLVGYTAF